MVVEEADNDYNQVNNWQNKIMFKKSLYLNWKGYHLYNSTNVNDYAPKNTGVYKLAVKLKNGNLKPFYVGQTLDLNDRLTKHLSSSEENDCIKDNIEKYICSFRFALVSSGNDRDGAERKLFLYYRPECNDPDAIPSGPDIDINYN